MSHQRSHHMKPDQCLWTIRHQIPGRVRLQGQALVGDHRLAHGIRGTLAHLPGVKLVRPSTASGSILIIYDETEQSPEMLIEAIRHCHRVGNRWDDTLEAREVEAVHLLVERLAQVDHQLRQASGNRITLRELALALITGKATYHVLWSGVISLEAVESLFEVFLSWILFRHRRLEHEVEQLESYVSPGV